MKSKLFSLFVALSLLASLLGAGSVLAQSPTPPQPPPAYPAGEAGHRAQRTSLAADVGAESLPLGTPGLSFRYVKTFGKIDVAYLADTKHLNYPWGIGTAGNNLWVGELWGRTALKYSSAGGFLQRIGTPGDPDTLGTTLTEIADVVADGAGDVWLADGANSRVTKFDPSGQRVRDLSGFGYSVGVAVDGSGNLYVSDGTPWYDGSGDNGNQRIQIFDSSGNYLATIGVTGVSGTDNSHLHGPKHLTVYGSQLYVADAGNQRVQIFDITTPSAPSYVDTIGVTGVPGGDSAHFNYPSGVAVDTDYIYVADTFNNRVQVFDRLSHAYAVTIGGTWGTANNQFENPTDVAVDAGHRLYVADFVNVRVQQFTHVGTKFTYARTYGVRGIPYLTDARHYNGASGVAVAGDGSIYVTEDAGHRLVKLNASGTPIWTIGAAGVKGDWNDENNRLNNPVGVSVDAVGRVYVADTWHGRIQVYSSTGAYLATVDGLGCPYGVYAAPGGGLYVADSCDATVKIYDASLVLQNEIGVSGVPGSDNAHLSWPTAVTVDGNGTIYVADPNNERIQVFDAGRNYVRTIGVAGICNSDFAHLCYPYSVFADSANRLYVADTGNTRVQVFDAGGSYLTTIGGAWSKGNNGFRDMRHVTVDSAGNVYIADYVNHVVQKYAPGFPGWTQSNLNGFGGRQNVDAEVMNVFDGQLYVATSAWGPFQLWRTPDGSTWSAVGSDGFGDGHNWGAGQLTIFNNQLYVGLWNCTTWDSNFNCTASDGGQVWRSSTGNTGDWSKVVDAGFGSTNHVAVNGLMVFQGPSDPVPQIYAVTTAMDGKPQVWRSSSGDLLGWSQVTPASFGNGGIWSDVSMSVYGEHLYIGVRRDPGVAELWRCQTCDGTDWSPVFTNGLAANNSNMLSTAEFNGAFYIGLENDVQGGQLWKSTNGTTFTRVFAGGLGNKNNKGPQGLYVSGGSLYLSFSNLATGAEVWRSLNGTNWTKIASGGWGDANNTHADYFDKGAAVFDGRLYIGTDNIANGGEVWSMAVPQTWSYTSDGSLDGWILESAETSNMGGTMDAAATTFILGDDATKKQYRSVLSFDTSAIPDTAIIQSAMLKIEQSGVPTGISPFSVLGGLLVDIRQPFFGTSSDLELLDFNASASALKVGTFGKVPASGWYSAKLNATGLGNINKNGLTQVRLRFTLDDNNNLAANYLQFFSGDAALADRPVLIITYLVP